MYVAEWHGQLEPCILKLDSDGNLWYLGNTLEGYISPANFTKLPSDEWGNIVQVSAGYGFFLLLKCNGEVYGWGSNEDGQLSGGTTNYYSNLHRIFKLNSIIEISSVDNFILALDSDGNVWGCGDNGARQLGNGNATVYTPKIIESLPRCSKILATSRTGHAIDTEGRYWCWGNRRIPSYTKLIFQVEAFVQVGDKMIFLDSERNLWEGVKTFEKSRNNGGIVQLVASARREVYILDELGHVYTLVKEQWHMIKLPDGPVLDIYGNRSIFFMTESDVVWTESISMLMIQGEEHSIMIGGKQTAIKKIKLPFHLPSTRHLPTKSARAL